MNQEREHHQNTGAGNPQAKLREVEVRAILLLYRRGAKCKDLAKFYDMSIPAIQKITSRRSWKNVTI